MRKIKGFCKRRYKMKTLELVKKENLIIKPEWAQLCDECFSATQKNGWTKEDSRKLLKETRKELRQIEAY